MQGMPAQLQLLEVLQCLLRLPRSLVKEVFGNWLVNTFGLNASTGHLELKVFLLGVIMYKVNAEFALV